MLDAKAKPSRVTVIELETHSYSVPSVFIKILHINTNKKCCTVGYTYIYIHTHTYVCVYNIYANRGKYKSVMLVTVYSNKFLNSSMQ